MYVRKEAHLGRARYIGDVGMSRIDDDDNWHLDRKVTISLIVAMTINMATTVWWASAISAAVATLQTNDIKQDILTTNNSIGRESNANRITSLEAKATAVDSKLGRIEDKLDRIIEHQTKQ